MKKQVLTLALFLIGFLSFAQAPTISGDTMLCPWTDGTAQITSSQTYDTYQWYYKYWFLDDEYQAIDGATGPTFTYDWYTYDQSLFKVVVTSGATTYESNTIQIDSWNWTSFLVMYEDAENFTFDPDTQSFLLCDGTSVTMSINNPPYSENIQWFKNDEPIDGANQPSYTITSAGVYKVSAAPSVCPNNSSTSLEFPVQMNSNCQLAVGDSSKKDFTIYPNPANNQFTVKANTSVFNQYFLFDMTGKKVGQGALNQSEQTISIANLESGIYLISLKGENTSTTHKIVKQ
ncbi:T9SS type A sorting domain-containing protein [Flavobacterium sp.]|uniref:T9SS type A sorting domain-containing protein n=1 Tax=Flavobacterium sp. TaxID=239 RepID=UPI00122826E6|nr:T9SS type A sorting domain-containing protein [Flavobacterium sp.]RZJ73890.1 MAG: T9SS type A sorting domain-containing protein [Flavobacterium sp.]